MKIINNRWIVGAGVLLLLAGIASRAHAETIDFSSLPLVNDAGYSDMGNSINQSGFTFTSGYGDFVVWDEQNPNLPGLSVANTSLFEYYADAVTTLTDGGSAFTINSIDLAPVLAGGASSFGVTITGTYADTSTVSQSCTVDDSASTSTPPELQTCALTNFTDVVSVSFSQGTNSGLYGAQISAYQFDNLVINSSSGPSVPEPTSLTLLCAGILGLAGSLKRKFFS